MENAIQRRGEAGGIGRLDPELVENLDVSATRPLSENTKRSYKADVRAFNEWIRETGRAVGADALEDYFDMLAEGDELTPATLNRRKYAIMRVLGAMFEEPQRTAVLAAVRQAAPSYKTEAAVDPDSILSKQQVEHLAAEGSGRLGLIIEFFWRTAVRVSELTSIRLQDVTLNGKATIRIRGKGNKERRVKVPLEFYERIRETFGGEKYLFETRGGNPYNRSNLYRQLNRLGERIGFCGPVNPHVFRHSRATYMLIELNMSLKAVSRFLGHSSTAITADLYIHDRVDYNDLFEADNGFCSE